MPKRALISVSDKRGLIECAARLQELDFEILSTGGTHKALAQAGIDVTPVEHVTKFPECFDGRVKTMHPLLMGGILFRRGTDDDDAKKLGIEPIDLVIVNLYPFASNPSIEMIDIGGPTLLRSAAKNHESVTVICDPDDYNRVLDELKKGGSTSLSLRKELAGKVFLHTASYDALITEHLSYGGNTAVMLTQGENLRYGENPHQWGKYYRTYDGVVNDTMTNDQNSVAKSGNGSLVTGHSLVGWGMKHQGKALSYLNILDADAAWTAVRDFFSPSAVFVKHACPSGIASNETIEDAFQRAYDADRLSAFGVIIALNRACTQVIAQKIIDQKIFVEVLVAPGYAKEALELLKQKPNLRVIEQQMLNDKCNVPNYRSVTGGMLVQNSDEKITSESDLNFVSKKKPTKDQIRDMLFAFTCVKHTKSNAIVLVKDLVTIGIGAGQTSRVDATWIAARRAGEKAKGAVMASDAFFPFPDSVEEAAKHGIAAIIQPGGSVRDAEVFAKADELGIVMVATGIRAFKH
jgi:phosphoribosylaminoimidazolecarboxamide formyltransferase/IMP cyclohydrolase